MSKQHRKIQHENRNENIRGADWSLTQTGSPSLFRFRENEQSATHRQNIFLKTSAEISQENRKTRTATIQRLSTGKRSHVKTAHQDRRTQHTAPRKQPAGEPHQPTPTFSGLRFPAFEPKQT